MQTIHHHLRWAVALLLIAAFLLPSAPVALAQDIATVHYFRPDGDYTDWGLHAWDGAAVAVEWGAPLPPTGEDDFGVYGKCRSNRTPSGWVSSFTRAKRKTPARTCSWI